MSAKETLIKVENLQKYYKGGAIKALDGINTEIKKGEVVVVIGPSGSGKSTFLRCLNLLEVPTGGHILFEGTDITDEKTNINLHRQKMGMVFQHFNLFPHMTILKNMTIAPMMLLKKSETEATEKAMELLRVFDLDGVADYKAANLPYGKQRKLEIARALATNPKLLLLDEPAAGMNPNETEELMETIEIVRKRFGVTVLLIEHDMKLVSGICEYLYVLNFGRLLAEGTPKEVLSNPEVVKAYLGE